MRKAQLNALGISPCSGGCASHKYRVAYIVFIFLCPAAKIPDEPTLNKTFNGNLYGHVKNIALAE
jgi:hypothetical protein